MISFMDYCYFWIEPVVVQICFPFKYMSHGLVAIFRKFH
jgi:hypothetical protein